MRVGIIGYGKMGVIIRQTALKRGHQVTVVIDRTSGKKEVTGKELTSACLPLDVIIDFSEPWSVVDNIKRYGELKLSAVIGTTGWYDKMDQVSSLVERSGIGLLWSGNFSLGANLFFQLVRAAGRAMNLFPQYDAMVHEYHHRQKADCPSSTEQIIGNILIDTLERKSSTVTGFLDRPIESFELHISSTRGGSIPGTHQVIFDSDVDSILLEHSTRNRSGFAEGALAAAEWIQGRQGLYEMEDMMQSIIGGEENQKFI